MDYVKPAEVVEAMVAAGDTKGSLPAKDLLIRGNLSGALLGIATSLALTGTVQTNVPLVGALIFPVGFVLIVLVGLELATGSFALLPLAVTDHKLSARRLLTNFGWVLLGNLIGSSLYAILLTGALASADWWVWNQIPVTIGNFVGGALFTGFALYLTYKPSSTSSTAVAKREPAAEPHLAR